MHLMKSAVFYEDVSTNNAQNHPNSKFYNNNK